MKITCESCAAQYDVDEARIPASGLHMKCPACLHEFDVPKPGGSPPGPRLIDLPDDDDAELPAPKPTPPKPMTMSKVAMPAVNPPKPGASKPPSLGELGDDDEADLVAPVARKPGHTTGPMPTRSTGPMAVRSDTRNTGPMAVRSDTRNTGPMAVRSDTRNTGPMAVRAEGGDNRFDLPDEEDAAELPAPRKDAAELPAPKSRMAPLKPPPPRAPVDEDLVELPAPRAAKPRDDQPELPAPRTKDVARPEQAGLPAPRTKDQAELPVPRAAAPKPPTPPPGPGPGSTAPRPPTPPTVAPPTPRPPTFNPPAPRAVTPPTSPPPLTQRAPMLDDDSIALPAPRAANHDTAALDAPDEEDLLLAPRPGPASMELELDVVAPKADLLTPKLQPEPKPERIELPTTKAELPTPVATPPVEIDVVAPKPGPEQPSETMDVAPKAKKKAKKEAPAPATSTEPDEKPPRKPWRMPALVIGGVVVTVIAVGVGLGLLTGTGVFGSKLWGGKRAEHQARLVAARKLLGDDTLSSYRKAAVDLRLLGESDPSLYEAAALEATARLAMARLGVVAELKTANTVVDRLDAEPKANQLAETLRVDAQRMLVVNKLSDARTRTKTILAAQPTDAASLTLLGAIEEQAGNLAEAQADYGKALAQEPTRVPALVAAARGAERAGDLKKAAELFGRALQRSPQHFGAQVGLIRVGEADAAAQKKLDDLVQSRASQVAPRELADGWATLGLLALKAGRFDEAEDRLKRSLGLDPEARAPRFLLSRLQCDAGRCKEALPALQRLIATDTGNEKIRTLLAQALLETGSADEAQRVIEPLAAAKDPQTLFVRARVMVAVKQADKAVALFKDAIAADGTLFPAYLALAKTLGDLGRADEAATTLKLAEQKATDDAGMLLELGQAYQRLGNFTSAEAMFRAALAKAPSTLARFGLGEALDAQGKDAEAGAVYTEIAAAAPETPGLDEHQARVLARLGKTQEAYALYTKALASGVPPAGLRLSAADVALDLGKTQEARALAEAVLKEDERSSHARVVLARVLSMAGQYNDALVEARRAAALADLPEAHLLIGHILEQLNRLDQAVLEYNQARRGTVIGEATLGRARILVRMGATRDAVAELGALAKNPRLRGQALVLLGDSYTDLQQRDKARKAYEDAIKAAPENGDALFKLARALVDSGKRKDSVPLLERAVKIATDKDVWAADAYLLLGDAHREVKEAPQAIKAYQRYLELAPADASARNEVKRHITLLGGSVAPVEP